VPYSLPPLQAPKWSLTGSLSHSPTTKKGKSPPNQIINRFVLCLSVWEPKSLCFFKRFSSFIYFHFIRFKYLSHFCFFLFFVVSIIVRIFEIYIRFEGEMIVGVVRKSVWICVNISSIERRQLESMSSYRSGRSSKCSLTNSLTNLTSFTHSLADQSKCLPLPVPGRGRKRRNRRTFLTNPFSPLSYLKVDFSIKWFRIFNLFNPFSAPW